MGQIVQQSVTADLVAVVTKNNSPVTGLIHSDLTCAYKKETQTSFTAKTLNVSNFIEIGNGVYTVEFTSAELDQAGSFVFVLTGATIDQSVTVVNVSATANPANTPVSVNKCIINGHIYTLDGEPAVGVAVTARILSVPTVLSGIGILDDSITVKTDATGEFFIELVRLAEVYVDIPSIQYRRIFVVPNSASVNLFSGIP